MLFDWRRAGSRGQSYVEYLLVLPIFLIIIAVVIDAGRLVYAKLATEAAAWSGARHAIATLDEDRGVAQAQRATRYTLSGFALRPDEAEVHVSYWGGWGRGTDVRVDVCYEVPPPPVPFGKELSPTLICSRYTSPVYKWKSGWE